MKKIKKYTMIVIIVFVLLVLLFVAYIAIYPEISKVRKDCNQIEVGMSRAQVETILTDIRSNNLGAESADDNHIFVMKNGIDCSVKFGTDGFVEKVTSAQDGF